MRGLYKGANMPVKQVYMSLTSMRHCLTCSRLLKVMVRAG